MTVAARVRMAAQPTGGGPPAFDPLTQVTPLHAVWAEDPLWTNPGDGMAVGTLRNQSGGGDPAAVDTPTMRNTVSELGNKPAWEYDGTNDAHAVDITDVAQTFKVIVVFRFLTTPVVTRPVLGFGAGNLQGFYSTNTPAYRLNAGSTPSGGTPDANGHVARMNLAGASSQLWIDGSSVISGDSNTGSMTRWKLGCLGSGATNSTFGNVQIAFCGVYTGATSDVLLATLATDLATHYSL